MRHTSSSRLIESVGGHEALPLVEEIVDRPGHLKTGWLTNHEWAVVPVESGMHFDERDALLISGASKRAGVNECFAVATEPLEGLPSCYRVPTSAEGLLAFSRECGTFYFALVPATRLFTILCTPDDYFLVAGPRDFVTGAIGCDIKRGRDIFFQFAASDEWPESVSRYLTSVAEKYERFDGK